jgi:hypothetical protein
MRWSCLTCTPAVVVTLRNALCAQVLCCMPQQEPRPASTCPHSTVSCAQKRTPPGTAHSAAAAHLDGGACVLHAYLVVMPVPANKSRQSPIRQLLHACNLLHSFQPERLQLVAYCYAGGVCLHIQHQPLTYLSARNTAVPADPAAASCPRTH